MEAGLKRELMEETGLQVRLLKLLYVCDKPEDHLIHMTFLLEVDALDGLRLPTNEFETTPITAIEFVAPEDLPLYGFSKEWANRIKQSFPDAPRYAGLKVNIGL